MTAPDLSRGVRASDAEREQVAQLLQSAAAEGRLTPEEAGERLATASTATYRDDLNQLIADLPAARSSEPERRQAYRPRAGWLVWSAVRFAMVAMLFLAFWGFWGIRLLAWPLAFMAFAFFCRPWRRRRWGGPGWR